MQPHDPYNQPVPGGQNPPGPYPPAGGVPPSGGYPSPGYGQFGGYPSQGQPGMPPGPPPMGPGATQPGGKMPGTVITARVFQFIGGIFGLLLGGVLVVMGLAFVGEPGVTEAVEDTSGLPGGSVNPAQTTGFLVGMAAIPLVYGAISTLLASFMGKRSGGVLWGTVVFQALAGLVLILSFLGGSPGAVIPLVFTVGIIVLMVVPTSRAFYSPAPQGFAPGPQY